MSDSNERRNNHEVDVTKMFGLDAEEVKEGIVDVHAIRAKSELQAQQSVAEMISFVQQLEITEPVIYPAEGIKIDFTRPDLLSTLTTVKDTINPTNTWVQVFQVNTPEGTPNGGRCTIITGIAGKKHSVETEFYVYPPTEHHQGNLQVAPVAGQVWRGKAKSPVDLVIRSEILRAGQSLLQRLPKKN